MVAIYFYANATIHYFADFLAPSNEIVSFPFRSFNSVKHIGHQASMFRYGSEGHACGKLRRQT